MAGAWDRLGRHSDNDHDPLRSGTDYENVVTDGAQRTGGIIATVLSGIAKLFGLTSLLDILDGEADGTFDPSGIWSNVTGIFIKPLGFFAELIGGFLSGSIIPILDPTKILNLPALFTTVSTGFANIYNGWFGGSSATGTPGEVATTVAAIKTAVLDGFTITIFPASNHAWPIPAGITQITGVVIGGGGRGTAGATAGTGSAAGGIGGSSGGYLSAELDITGLTPGSSTLDITVGAAAATAGANGAVSSIVASVGTLLSSSPNDSGIATKEGLVATSSKPGRGGVGGTVTGSGPSSPTISATGNGTAGEDSGVADGGGGGGGIAAGTATGGAGGAGQAGSSSDVPLCGGGGGGGGGSAGTTAGFIGSATGGAGGNGGYPGGGSGGGGGAMNASGGVNTFGGAPGAAGNGLVALIYK